MNTIVLLHGFCETKEMWKDFASELQKDSFTEKQLQLYSTCFQLLNIVEVNGAVQNRRKTEDLSNPNKRDPFSVTDVAPARNDLSEVPYL